MQLGRKRARVLYTEQPSHPFLPTIAKEAQQRTNEYHYREIKGSLITAVVKTKQFIYFIFQMTANSRFGPADVPIIMFCLERAKTNSPAFHHEGNNADRCIHPPVDGQMNRRPLVI